MTARGVHRSTLPEQEAQRKLSRGLWVHLAGEGTAEARRACKSQGDAQVKSEERRSCYGWGGLTGQGEAQRKLSGDAPHGTGGLRGLPCPRPASPAQPRPCTGRARRMPRADAGRFQPGEAEAFRVLRRGGARPPPCASPLPLHLSSPPRGGARRWPGTAGKVTDRGAPRDGQGGLLGFGTSRRPRGCSSRPVPRGMAGLGRAPRSSAPPGRGAHGGAAPQDAVRSPPGPPSLSAAPRSRSAHSRELLSAQCVRSRYRDA